MGESSHRLRWLDTVASEEGPRLAVTRHVMLTLGKHMNPAGECFPSIRLLARETALDERTVRRHLGRAVGAGWVERVSGASNGQGWRRYRYQALIPEGAGTQSSPQSERAGRESARCDEGAGTETETCGQRVQDVRAQRPPNPLNEHAQRTHKTSRAATDVAIDTFLEECRSADVKPIPPEDAVFTYADEVGIPHEYLRLAWREFVERNRGRGKKYKRWRQAFRNCVRENWYKLWWVNHDGEYQLTTTGVQAQRRDRAAQRQKEAAAS